MKFCCIDDQFIFRFRDILFLLLPEFPALIRKFLHLALENNFTRRSPAHTRAKLIPVFFALHPCLHYFRDS